jgi:hypothetical protein
MPRRHPTRMGNMTLTGACALIGCYVVSEDERDEDGDALRRRWRLTVGLDG